MAAIILYTGATKHTAEELAVRLFSRFTRTPLVMVESQAGRTSHDVQGAYPFALFGQKFVARADLLEFAIRMAPLDGRATMTLEERAQVEALRESLVSRLVVIQVSGVG